MTHPGDTGTICSLSGAIDVLQWLEESDAFFGKKKWSFLNFPFGLWFRGHSKQYEQLEPRVFRRNLCSPVIDSVGCWDEGNVYDHLKLRVPSHQHTYHSAFEWLCLMQHYSVPTRLLDWSESILPALYFAVRDDLELNGELIILNAQRLNSKSRKNRRKRPGIATPDSCHVIVQAEMATTRSSKRLALKKSVNDALQEEGLSVKNRWLEAFRKPIAVFPSRLNDRMIFQSSVFTIHGGKRYVDGMPAHYKGEIIPEPITLDEMNEGSADDNAILKRYLIPAENKRSILKDLFRLGIHEATLFPEVDRQAVYLQKLWWFGAEPSSRR